MAAKSSRSVQLLFSSHVVTLLTFMSRLDSCVFPVVTAVLALAYHALLAALCTYLPRDCLVLGYGLAGYASAGCAASLLGIYGIITVSSRKREVFVIIH